MLSIVRNPQLIALLPTTYLKAHAPAHARGEFSLMIMNIRQVRERARENGPGESVGEQIELSNQRDGSRGLPTAAHWPGLRVRYRIIAGTRRESPLRYIDAVHLSRRALESTYAPRICDRSRATIHRSIASRRRNGA